MNYGQISWIVIVPCTALNFWILLSIYKTAFDSVALFGLCYYLGNLQPHILSWTATVESSHAPHAYRYWFIFYYAATMAIVTVFYGYWSPRWTLLMALMETVVVMCLWRRYQELKESDKRARQHKVARRAMAGRRGDWQKLS